MHTCTLTWQLKNDDFLNPISALGSACLGLNPVGLKLFYISVMEFLLPANQNVLSLSLPGCTELAGFAGLTGKDEEC